MLSYCSDVISQDMMMSYHTTFSSATGRQVLKHMLRHFGVLDITITDPVHLVLSNVGKQILKNCGIWNEGNVDVMLSSLFGIPPMPKPKRRSKDVRQ